MTIARGYVVRLSPHSGYGASLIRFSSREIEFLPKNLPNSYLGIPPIPTEEIKNTSEESNETSEESNHKSEEFAPFLGSKWAYF